MRENYFTGVQVRKKGRYHRKMKSLGVTYPMHGGQDQGFQRVPFNFQQPINDQSNPGTIGSNNIDTI